MNTHIIFRKKLFAQGIIYLLFCSSIGVLATYLLWPKYVGVFMLVILFLPLLFIKKLFKKFTKEVTIEFNTDYFTIDIVNQQGDNTTRRFELSEIKSYCIKFPNERFSSIRFQIKDGKTFEYSFFKNRMSNEDVDVKELIGSFKKFIYEYNKMIDKDKIILKPSFYASRSGLYCIIGLTFALIIALIFGSIYKPKALSITFIFSLLLIIQLITKRKRELEYYKKELSQSPKMTGLN